MKYFAIWSVFASCALVASMVKSYNSQKDGAVVVSEDSVRGVVCYSKNNSTDRISCVKVK